MSASHAQRGTFPDRNIIAMPAFLRRPLNAGIAALTAALRHFTVSDFEVENAREALRQAERALLEAENWFDTDRGVNPKPLIGRIKVAEARVQASRAALRKVDPRSTE
jgi:hypothetical protein